MEDNSDIVIKFKKDNGNIFLESINDSGEDKTYDSNLPLLTINENGSYSKVENPQLNEIITSSVEEPILRNKEEVDNNFDYTDVYNTNEVLEGNPPTNTNVLPSTTEEVAAGPSNKVIEEGLTNEVVEDKIPTNEVVEDKIPTNEVVEDKIPTNEVVEDKIPTNEVVEDKIPTNEVVEDKIPTNEVVKPLSFKEQLENNKLFKKIQENNKLEEGGRKTKKSKKGGKKKTKRVRFIMTRKGRKNRKNKTRR